MCSCSVLLCAGLWRFTPPCLKLGFVKRRTNRPNFLLPGPYRVLVGPTDAAGLAGQIYVPAGGKHTPLVVFAHDWLHGPEHYSQTLKHLASWGLTVIAPQVSGVVPEENKLADAITQAILLAPKLQLSQASTTVSPSEVSLFGHGMGAAAAIAVAAKRKVQTVVAAWPSHTDLGETLRTPGLMINGDKDPSFGFGEPAELAAAWPGAKLITLKKATSSEFAERQVVPRLLGLAGGKGKTQQQVRKLALLQIFATSSAKQASFAREELAKEI